MTVAIKYEVVSPAVLAFIVEALEVLCTWREVDEDTFSFTVMLPDEADASLVKQVEAILQKYL